MLTHTWVTGNLGKVCMPQTGLICLKIWVCSATYRSCGLYSTVTLSKSIAITNIDVYLMWVYQHGHGLTGKKQHVIQGWRFGYVIFMGHGYIFFSWKVLAFVGETYKDFLFFFFFFIATKIHKLERCKDLFNVTVNFRFVYYHGGFIMDDLNMWAWLFCLFLYLSYSGYASPKLFYLQNCTPKISQYGLVCHTWNWDDGTVP